MGNSSTRSECPRLPPGVEKFTFCQSNSSLTLTVVDSERMCALALEAWIRTRHQQGRLFDAIEFHGCHDETREVLSRCASDRIAQSILWVARASNPTSQVRMSWRRCLTMTLLYRRNKGINVRIFASTSSSPSRRELSSSWACASDERPKQVKGRSQKQKVAWPSLAGIHRHALESYFTSLFSSCREDLRVRSVQAEELCCAYPGLHDDAKRFRSP